MQQILNTINTFVSHLILVVFCVVTFAVGQKNIITIAQTTSSNQQVQPSQPTNLPSFGADFTTNAGNIYKNGEQIKLFGVSWFGFEDNGHSAHALWRRNLTEIVQQVKGMGFNAFRVPFCPETLRNVPTGYISEANNKPLVGLKSLDLMDKVVQEMNAQGMYILMDIHNYDCTNTLPPLWYTPAYSEQQLISDLTFVADRYKNLDHFVGIDIKNEPHDGDDLASSSTWGLGNIATDWNLAAERIGKAILTTNPNLLIFVEGIGDLQTYCSKEFGSWWGGNLMPIRCTPINPAFIPANKLVLSPHVYGPDVYNAKEFNTPDFPANLPANWDTYFGSTLSQGYTLAIGEFGGKYGHDDKYSKADPNDIIWQNKIIDYFIDKKICNFFYWSLNPDSSDTGGIMQPDWLTPWADKLANLQRLMTSCASSITPPPAVVTAPISDWSFNKFRTSSSPYLVGRLVR
jgi:endoglucanase